jgi:hypothetical protein
MRSTAFLYGALPLRYASGQLETQHTCMRPPSLSTSCGSAGPLPGLKARRQRPAFIFTHRVSLPQTRNPSPALAQRFMSGGQLPDLG